MEAKRNQSKVDGTEEHRWFGRLCSWRHHYINTYDIKSVYSILSWRDKQTCLCKVSSYCIAFMFTYLKPELIALHQNLGSDSFSQVAVSCRY